MPELCRFYGIIIKIYFGDHLPPHFHAEYNECNAQIDITTLGTIKGTLPAKAYALVDAAQRRIEDRLGTCKRTKTAIKD